MAAKDKKKTKKSKGEWWYHEKNVLLIELVKYQPVLYDTSTPLYNDMRAKKHAWEEIGNHLNTTGIRSKIRWEQLRSQHRKKLSKWKWSTTNSVKWKYEDSMSFLIPFMKDKKILRGEEDKKTLRAEDNKKTLRDEEDSESSDQYDYEIPIETIRDQKPVDKETKVIEIIRLQKCAEHNSNTKISRRQVAKRKKITPIPTATPISTAIPIPTPISTAIPIPTPIIPQQHVECPPAVSMKLPSEEKKDDLNSSQVYTAVPDPIDQFFSLMATTVKKFSAADQHLVKSRVFNLISEVEEKYLIQDQKHVQLVYTSSPLQYAESCNSQDYSIYSTTVNYQQTLQTSERERFHETAEDCA